MDVRKRPERRVDEQSVADVLRCIAAPPNKRQQPIAGDLVGPFDFWFDGGAARILTGNIVYEFASGIHATVGAPVPALSVNIEFADGCKVRVQQESWGSEQAG
jgi:hypothetical protein